MWDSFGEEPTEEDFIACEVAVEAYYARKKAFKTESGSIIHTPLDIADTITDVGYPTKIIIICSLIFDQYEDDIIMSSPLSKFSSVRALSSESIVLPSPVRSRHKRRMATTPSLSFYFPLFHLLSPH